MSDTTEDLVKRPPGEIRTPLRDPKNQIRLLHLEAGSDEDDISASLEIWDKREDLIEKMNQVSMMGEIYALASQVLASIGPADEYSEIVRMATLNVDAYLQSVPAAIFTLGTGLRNTGIKGLDMSLWHPPLDVASTVQFCNDFDTFSQRPYFSRAWIVQELAGGRHRTTILCGQEMMDWTAVKDISWRSVSIFEVLNIGNMLSPHQPKLDHRIGGLHLLIAGRSHRHYRIQVYLIGMLKMLCRDVRDRIFGTLTLLDWSRFGHLPPVPDYRLKPLEVGLQLLDKLSELDIWTVALIAKNLELSTDPELSRTQLSESLNNIECSSAANRNREWYTSAPELFIVRQDPAGRMQVDVTYRLELDTKPPMARRLSEISQETLSAHGLTRIFAGGNGSTVIGAVYMSLGCQRVPKKSSPGECAWWQKSETYEYEYGSVEIAMNLTNAQVLTAVICHEAVKLGTYDVLTYLGRHALGTVKANACAWGITAAGWQSHRAIGRLEMQSGTVLF
ncbi:hypothetical protein Q7P35_002313 [Cladosporium inversicolor]